VRPAAAALTMGLVLALSCRGNGGKEEKKESPSSASDAAPATALPIKTERARLARLERNVNAPGHTVALVQQKVRAPFAGTLLTLSVIDGDRVRRGDSVGTIVSRDSEAALAGAKEMEREARTSAEQEDAHRAIALAERNLIRADIKAPADGVVLSHAAAPGDRMTEDQEILALADAGSLVFVADVSQNDLSQIRPGQKASIALAGVPRPVSGIVHDVMPMANPAEFTAPVRIDLARGAPLGVGLFGTAHVVVAEKPNALVVPDAAILRDDVTGKTRIAVVRDGKVHWEEVTLGMRGAEGTEIVSPALPPGEAVAVEGLVGLPEGATVASQP
jgi:multidrug efflux pump subunit AcrA (membrane-fusion protein)